ncbi:unnamed protein product [Allacma fusca]|uniref:SLC41A/MgtE integral membrane domain-containing protein n=1 Tax=Allacma fusca TaxID=39272 RepID=A0A8J2PTC9_9HEXA|nr:unnamed protein product [Allacma fusca]
MNTARFLVTKAYPLKDTHSDQPLPEAITPIDTDTLLVEDESKNLNSTTSTKGDVVEDKKETWLTILLQVTVPFLIAGMGSVGAGLLLDYVSNWKPFIEVPEFLALVTPLLGLKGNLMMASASRLSTLTNMNKLETLKQKLHAFVADIFATQVLSIVAGFMASIVTIILGFANKQHMDYQHSFLLCASSILTSSLSASALGILIFGVIVLSSKVSVNPDNVATPLAASVGDVSSLAVLSGMASVLYANLDSKPWLCPTIIGFFAMIIPLLLFLTYRDKENAKILNSSWPRILISMVILSGGGVILEITSHRFSSMELYQPMINGVGGSLVSVQASRVSTYFHKNYEPGELPWKDDSGSNIKCQSPVRVFFKSGINSTAARVLLSLIVPGHLIFATITRFAFKSSNSHYNPLFLTLYFSAALLQVICLLYFCQLIVNVIWSRKGDPDLFAIPLLTATGDFLDERSGVVEPALRALLLVVELNKSPYDLRLATMRSI